MGADLARKVDRAGRVQPGLVHVGVAEPVDVRGRDAAVRGARELCGAGEVAVVEGACGGHAPHVVRRRVPRVRVRVRVRVWVRVWVRVRVRVMCAAEYRKTSVLPTAAV